MKRLPPFRMIQPASVAAASAAMADLGDDARLYAGGTELLLAMKEGALRFDYLIDIKTIPGLDELRIADGEVVIGAAVTHFELEHSQEIRAALPGLAELERRVANPRVRATGTLVGNLCFAEPHSDPATLLLCLDARVRVQSTTTDRWQGIHDTVAGPYETALKPDELVTEVVIPLPPKTWRMSYQKFQIHERPTLGLGVVFDLQGDELSDVRAAVGCVSPTPRRSARAEALLAGPVGSLSERLGPAADALADAAELIDDHEGGADYKRHLIRVFLGRAIQAALAG